MDDEHMQEDSRSAPQETALSADDAEAFAALSALLDSITATPLSRPLHTQHLALCQSTPALSAHLASAKDMYTSLLAVPENVWIPILDERLAETSFTVAEAVIAMHELFVKAEGDYLSVNILQRHATFLVELAELAAADEPSKVDGFDESGLREKLEEVVSRAEGDGAHGAVVWDIWMRWELSLVDKMETGSEERRTKVNELQQKFLDRIQFPHAANDETFASYSTFVSNYLPPDVYEDTMIKTLALRQDAVEQWSLRAGLEAALSSGPPAYEAYIKWAKIPKYMDVERVRCVYERALADAANRRTTPGPEADAAAKWEGLFWVGYITFIIEHAGSEEFEIPLLGRAVRAVPENGEVWAAYIRTLERHEHAEQISDIYSGSLATNLLSASHVVDVTLAYAGYLKRLLMSAGDENLDEELFDTLVAVLKDAVDKVRSLEGADPSLRLEKFFASIYVDIKEPSEEVMEAARKVWASAANRYSSSYLAWTFYAQFLWQDVRDIDKARRIYREASVRNQLDWPEAVWDAWLEFEHRFGSAEDIETALAKVMGHKEKWAVKRQQEAEAYQYQMAQAAQTASESTAADAPVKATGPPPSTMEVDTTPTVNGSVSKKRKAENEGEGSVAKRPKGDDDVATTAEISVAEPSPAPQKPLRRDRENTSVFVSGLPEKATEDDLVQLFRDCGEIREAKLSQVGNDFVATVEFFTKDSVAPALTKDKKRLHGEEVAVNLAWKSTLFVTNFPEAYDDKAMRELFGKFGTIFDVRWPSKRIKTTRRFCYMQYVTPVSANEALALHGVELEPDRKLSVEISDPSRRKERTDAQADKREVYVAGLAKGVKKEELEKLFGQKGPLKEVRIALEKDGSCKGYAFVEFEDEASAERALAFNNHELRRRRIAVTLADARAKARREQPDTGQGLRADLRSRSVRIRKIPDGTQEAVLQQILAKIAKVKKVVMKTGTDEAVVECDTVAEASKLVLAGNNVTVNGQSLEILEEATSSNTRSQAAGSSTGMFVPRAAGPRPKAGLGHKAGGNALRGSGKPVFVGEQTSAQGQDTSAGVSGKGQDDFRKMLSSK